MTWTLQEALDLCREIEAVCPQYGCHVALTGGLLYKDGPRKDCDLIFYRIRQVEEIDESGLMDRLAKIGIEVDPDDNHDYSNDQWLVKALYKGRSVDLMFPETMSPFDMKSPDSDEPPEF